jgi:uncharacterized membrane protein YdbT with pleckstrin-like domain
VGGWRAGDEPTGKDPPVPSTRPRNALRRLNQPPSIIIFVVAAVAAAVVVVVVVVVIVVVIVPR